MGLTVLSGVLTAYGRDGLLGVQLKKCSIALSLAVGGLLISVDQGNN